jgi:hypothetical protein
VNAKVRTSALTANTFLTEVIASCPFFGRWARVLDRREFSGMTNPVIATGVNCGTKVFKMVNVVGLMAVELCLENHGSCLSRSQVTKAEVRRRQLSNRSGATPLEFIIPSIHPVVASAFPRDRYRFSQD